MPVSWIWRLGLGLAALWLLATACTTSQPTPTPPPGQQVTVTFFDVGESGDGFLVSTWEKKWMLVDGGRRNSGVVNFLKTLNAPRIDVMIATNPDADHIGGLIDVLKALPIGEVWLSGDLNTTITFEDFIDAVQASGATIQAARRGDVIQLGSLSLPVLNPSDPRFSDRNNNSVAVRMDVGKVSFLFTGDMEEPAESRLVASGADLKATVLKLGHHGSRTSTSQRFVSAVQPQVAVYQAGANNRFGHPHAETLTALARGGVTVYGTDRNGVITITTDGNTYKVETERQ
jgi:competence protein ComEC